MRVDFEKKVMAATMVGRDGAFVLFSSCTPL
jgi:hypothetical protein